MPSVARELETYGLSFTGNKIKTAAVETAGRQESLVAAIRRIVCERTEPAASEGGGNDHVAAGDGVGGGCSGSSTEGVDAVMVVVGGLKAPDQQNSSKD